MRNRLAPSYVDWHDIPDDPPSPYQARLTFPPEQTVAGVEVREREVVRGTVTVVYQVRCVCRRRWFMRRFERVQLCPRCGRAVLLDAPDSGSPRA
jgi:hypothetical protein